MGTSVPEGPDAASPGSESSAGNGGADASPAHSGSLSFLFFSDTQPDPESMDHTGVGELIAQATELHGRPELVVFGGDTIDDGSNEAEWGDFREAVGSSLDGAVTAAIAGNHDRHALLAGQFDYPTTAPTSPGEGFFYSLRSGPVFFVMLDSNIMGSANQRDIDWLRDALQSEAARDAVWRIAVTHHPMWTVSDVPKDIERAVTMRERFLPLLEEYGVDLVLCGHQHVYSRTLPMRGDDAAADGRGIVQLMAATGYKSSYAIGERDYIAAALPAPNYLLLSADGERITATAYDSEHKAIDLFTLRKPPLAAGNDGSWRIHVVNTAGEELWSFGEAELASLPAERSAAFAHAYSTINNWPSARFYAADGYRVESILSMAGALDAAQTVTFRSEDGYETSLTREQLFSGQYYFPMVGESDAGAAPVAPIIAFRWREGTADLSELYENKPTLIFGQRDPFEQTNPAFVEGVSEIVVDVAPSLTWPAAGTFPLPGPIAEGETVKLQHPSFGRVKLHYTLDGSDPTPLSEMYNPSTYQLELNAPIPIIGPTTIKVLVTGYGMNDSEIAVFDFWTLE